MRYSDAVFVLIVDSNGSEKPAMMGDRPAVFLNETAANHWVMSQGIAQATVMLRPVFVVSSFEFQDSPTTAQKVNLIPQTSEDIGLMELARESAAIAKSKGWAGQSVPETMALFHSEISEAFEEYRNGRDMHEVYESEGGKPEGYPVELADLQIRLAHHVGEYKIDIVGAIRKKATYNRSRPYRHGGKKC